MIKTKCVDYLEKGENYTITFNDGLTHNGRKHNGLYSYSLV